MNSRDPRPDDYKLESPRSGKGFPSEGLWDLFPDWFRGVHLSLFVNIIFAGATLILILYYRQEQATQARNLTAFKSAMDGMLKDLYRNSTAQGEVSFVQRISRVESQLDAYQYELKRATVELEDVRNSYRSLKANFSEQSQDFARMDKELQESRKRIAELESYTRSLETKFAKPGSNPR